jgi:PST family polysaccharide transporter
MSARNSSAHRLVRSSFFSKGKNIGARTAQGAGFTFAGVATRFLISMGSTAALARLLTPADFGEIAMAMIITELANLFANVGLQSILVQKKRLFRIQLDTIFWAGLGLGLCLMAAVVTISFFAGDFFHDDKIGVILRISSFTFVLEELRVVQSSIMFRLMMFKLDFYLQAIGLVLRSVFAIGLAMMGLGVFSMVLGPLLGLMVIVVVTWVVIPYRPRFRFSRTFVARHAKIGANYLGGGFLFYCVTNFDLMVIGRLLGATQLGYYQTARSLTDELRARITTPLQRVLFPAYAQIQNDQARFQKAVLRSTGLISLIIVPLGVGMAAIAPEMVGFLLGDRWLAVVPVLSIIAIAGTLRATFSIGGPIFNSINRTDASLRLNTVNAIIFFGAILAGSPWGAQGVAYGSLASAMAFSLVAVGAFRLIGLSWRDMVLALVPTYLAGAIMFAVVLMARQCCFAPGQYSMVIQMPALIIVGAIAYLASVALLSKSLLLDAFAIVSGILARREQGG